MAYAGLDPAHRTTLTAHQLSAYVEAEDERRDYYKKLVQYGLWFMLRQFKSPPPVQDIDPVQFIDNLIAESKMEKTISKQQQSDIFKRELRRKQDLIMQKNLKAKQKVL